MTELEIQQQLPNRGRPPHDFHLELFNEHRFEEPPVCCVCKQPCSPRSFAHREFCESCLDAILPDRRDYWKVWDAIINSTVNPAEAVGRVASQVAVGVDPVQSAASAPQASVYGPGGMAVPSTESERA